mmetsp:Transcript_6083/g.14725  ORF Transcript_6083/g.14725 Transcript_6083/m.14725 type:complete len:294 (-) Transcript_6083:75-956(-)
MYTQTQKFTSKCTAATAPLRNVSGICVLRVSKQRSFGTVGGDLPRRTTLSTVFALQQEREHQNSSTSQKTLSNLENLLGTEDDDKATEDNSAIEEDRSELTKATATPDKEKEKPMLQSRTNKEPRDWILEDFEEDGSIDFANRSLASVSYVLPLLDGLHYARFIFMQVPQFALVLLPLAPAIELFESFRWLQIVFFFALALGVANNRGLPKFTRFNAQQAILLDIIQILPELLLGGKGPPPGDDFLIQATIIATNTVFIYVYLCCLSGAVASLNGKAVRLPLLGSAAESQAQR